METGMLAEVIGWLIPVASPKIIFIFLLTPQKRSRSVLAHTVLHERGAAYKNDISPASRMEARFPVQNKNQKRNVCAYLALIRRLEQCLRELFSHP